MNHSAPSPPAELNWFTRNEFLWRRLHSLSGLVPVGAYMCVHLLTNASVNDSPSTFQENVYTIHALGSFLPIVEWVFIFLPLIFHAILGVVIIRGGQPNVVNYPYPRNTRYFLQRVSGMIAFVFIFWHVFHMHGWFHNEAWLANVVKPLQGAQFRPYNASTSLHLALSGAFIPTLYALGMLACVFHLANGLWTMGITWGIWVSPAAQRRANYLCVAFGIGLGIVGLSAIAGAKRVPLRESLSAEDAKYDAKINSHDIEAERAEHKRWSVEEREKLQKQLEAESTTRADAAASETSPTGLAQ